MVYQGATKLSRKRQRNATKRKQCDGGADPAALALVRYSVQLSADEAILGLNTIHGADVVLLRRNGLVERRTQRLHYQAEQVFLAAAARQDGRAPSAFSLVSVTSGLLLAIGDTIGQVHFYDVLQSEHLESIWVNRGSPITCLAFGPRINEKEGSITIASSSVDGKLRLLRGPAAVGEAFRASRGITQTAWYLERGIQVSPQVPLKAMAWLPGGDAIAVGTEDGQVRLVSTLSGTNETIALLKQGGKALAVEALACMMDQQNAFLAVGDAAGRLLLWALNRPNRGEALAVFDSIDNCHGGMTHVRILSPDLILFGSSDGGVGFLQRSWRVREWFVCSRPQRLHRGAIRTSGVFYHHEHEALGIFTGAEDARLCVVPDVMRHLQVPGKIQRLGALRFPAMLPSLCWPDPNGGCLLPQVPAKYVALHQERTLELRAKAQVLRFPGQTPAAERVSGAVSLLLGHPSRTFWLVCCADSAKLYHRSGKGAELIPLSSKQSNILSGATTGVAVSSSTFVVLARDRAILHILAVQSDCTTSKLEARLGSVVLPATDALCLCSDGHGHVGIGFASGTLQCLALQPRNHKKPKLKPRWTGQVQAPPCAMYLDPTTQSIWTIDAAHWLAENGVRRLLLPTPLKGCYSLLSNGPNDTLLAAENGRVLQLWMQPRPRQKWIFSCKDRVWAVNYATQLKAVLLIHGDDAYTPDEQFDMAIGRKRFGT
jgi:WD40 repeat protein